MIWEKNVLDRENSKSERMRLKCLTKRKGASLARAQRLKERMRNEVGRGQIL